MRNLATIEGVDYVSPNKRLSHHSGDWQAFINSLVYAKQTRKKIAVKISQRLVPVLPDFWKPMLDAMDDPAVCVVAPGRLDRKQVARPAARFFTKFPLMTDVLAMRVDAVDPELLLDVYRDRFNKATTHHDVLVEFAWNHLILNHFKDHVVTLDAWSNHKIYQPKLYLRRSQSLPHEYAQLAAMEGVTGNWNVAEWAAIERKGYLCRPRVV